MAAPTYSVTLHHLAPGAKAAGLGYAEEPLPAVTGPQLVELLHALSDVASRLTIYEPSTPEIRIKTDRDVYVIRTRYRRLCFVGREALLRGEEHTVTFIMGTITGIAEPVVKAVAAPRAYERPPSASPTGGRSGGIGLPEWAKIGLMMVLSAVCLGGGVWMLIRPARSLAPKFDLISSGESSALLLSTAGEYRTGQQEGDRRLIIGSDGTIRIAKYGPAQAIAEELIRTSRGARKDGADALVTTDPYIMLVKGPDTIELFGQTYRRVVP